MAGILVLAEFERSELRPEFWELITLAAEFGTGGGPLRVALVGAGLNEALEEARRAGADEVITIQDSRLADPWPEGHAEAMAAMCGAFSPDLVLMPRTLLGVEAAARLAIRFGWPLLKDVTRFEKGSDGIIAARPVFGGAVSATLMAPQGPWIVVPRPRAFAAARPKEGALSPVVRQELTLTERPKTHCGARQRQHSSGKDIERARVLVAGGGGLGGPEPFRLLDEIAELLGGTVAASRVACDAGWAPTVLQVGLTGKTVAPDLYLAVGISGATQHLAGCTSAQAIAVINSDKHAPFFRLANYGVVGDWKDVMPSFRDALKQKLRSGVCGS